MTSDPIEQLIEEHEFILSVINALENYALQLDDTDSFQHKDVVEFLGFFENYVGAYHQVKEELLLSVELEDVGFNKRTGPLAFVLMKHKPCRNFLERLHEFSCFSAADQTRRFKTMVSDYVSLLRRHIREEDRVLYFMAKAKVSEKISQELAEKFRLLEQEKMPPRVLATLRRMGHRLIRSYVPSERVADTGTCITL